LMPMIKATGEEAASATSAPVVSPSAAGASVPGESLPADPDRLRRERKELERIRGEKIETLQRRLFIQVLEIDSDTGELYYQEASQRLRVAGEDAAVQLIARHRQEAGRRELYYLFLFPRRMTGYPEERQIRKYEQWFKGVAHGMDNPLSAR